MEQRHVILPPTVEVRVHLLSRHKENLTSWQAILGLATVVELLVQFFIFLGATVGAEYAIEPPPDWLAPYEWTSTGAAILIVLTAISLGAWKLCIKKERRRLSTQAETCTLADPELIKLAGLLEEVCEAALRESVFSRDDDLKIYTLRRLGYAQLSEAEAGVRTTDSFARTIEEVRAIHTRLAQARQRRELAK